MPEMIFVPQRSISKSGLGGGACKLLPLQEDFGSFAASCLGGGAGRQQGGRRSGFRAARQEDTYGVYEQTSRKSCGGLVMLEDRGF